MLIRFFGVLALALLSTSVAASTLAQYQFTGSIDATSLDGTTSSLNAMSTVSGSFTFDTAVLSYNQIGTSVEQYATGSLNYTVVNPVSVGGIPVDQLASGGTTLDPGTQVNNNSGDPMNPIDVFNIIGAAGNSGAPSSGLVFDPKDLSLIMIDAQAAAFDSTSLSLLPTLLLADFQFPQLVFRLTSGGTPVRFDVDSLTAVPLPAGIWLFLTAIGLLYHRARRTAA